MAYLELYPTHLYVHTVYIINTVYILIYYSISRVYRALVSTGVHRIIYVYCNLYNLVPGILTGSIYTVS